MIRRRDFLKSAAGAGAGMAFGGLLGSTGCSGGANRGVGKKKVLVLGLDGLDPGLVRQFCKEGLMPHFAQFMSDKVFTPLGTTLPPQSPVAWATFSSGVNPGGHGIFDFIHRHPEDYIPYFAGSLVEPGKEWFHAGDWVVPNPFHGGKAVNMRHGPTLWVELEKNGVPCTVFKVPSNFPPTECASRTFAGMGTPDLLGTYGTFSFYSEKYYLRSRDVSGGRIIGVRFEDNALHAKLEGPPNSYRKGGPPSSVEFSVYRDPHNAVAVIEFPDQKVVLKEGEWSDWVRLSFEMVPHLSDVKGIVRLYLKKTRDDFGLYISPINIDPANPALPVCTPAGYGEELCKAVGPFYTKTFPEDFAAARSGVFDDHEYLSQTQMALDEQVALLEYSLRQYNEGFMFFYFSTIDQTTHIMWRTMDERHPMYDPKAAPKVKAAVRHYYSSMDTALKMAMDKVDDHTTLMICSDHGFGPFYRQMNVNTWLLEKGYLHLRDPGLQAQTIAFNHVDWSRTKLYAYGLNGMYVNRKGREAHGIVEPGEVDAFIDQVCAELDALVDPKSNERVMIKAHRGDENYSGPYVAKAPDIVLGYARGFRGSDESNLGSLPPNWIDDRMDKWSGEHCVDPSEVPGTLICNKSIRKSDPSLVDMAPTILAEFGVQAPRIMEGRSIFA